MIPPRVSVIVPTYNRAHMLTEAIDSILGQTFGDFELIVVDDFSLDNTEDAIKSYADKRIRCFKNQSNRIIAANRNYGISKAQGEYIAFCDDDDLWYPEKLEKCLEVFEQDKDIILVCHDEEVVRDGKTIRVSTYGPYVEPMYYNLLLKGNCLGTSTVVVAKEALLRVGGFDENPDFVGVEDYDLWVRLALMGKFYFLHEILSEYRLHDSRYSSDIERHTRRCLNIVEHHFRQLSPDELREHKREIKKVKSNILFGGGWANLLRGDFSKAKNWFKEGIRVYPLSFRNRIGFTLASFRICSPQGVIKIVKAITGK